MRHTQSFFSLPSMLILLSLFAGFGMTLWRSGGLTFSPGRLSAKKSPGIILKGYLSHAEFERECSFCHRPLKTIQANLCLECHTAVSSEIASSTGLHASFEQVTACAQCHSDHKGRNFDPLMDAMDNFDHSTTTFDLIKHQVNFDASLIECNNCHIADSGYEVSVSACASCHATGDMAFVVKHTQDFGDQCLACHDGLDSKVNINHSTTDFPLLGQHQSLECADCHKEEDFANTPVDCISCHAEPQIHIGLFNLDCAICHTAQAWEPAFLDGRLFNHRDNSAFNLIRHAKDFAGNTISCKGCHPTNFRQFDMETCTTCHSGQNFDYMAAHIKKFGNACLECHDGVDRMNKFDHDKVFVLDGRHREVDCAACHIDYSFRGTSKECVECHAEPEIHSGTFGIQCQFCHTTIAWSPAELQVHAFPINHGEQGDQACSICHSNVYFEYTCYSCHDHQPIPLREKHIAAAVSLEEFPNCVKCHPSGE